jgi:hypothetical protein
MMSLLQSVIQWHKTEMKGLKEYEAGNTISRSIWDE